MADHLALLADCEVPLAPDGKPMLAVEGAAAKRCGAWPQLALAPPADPAGGGTGIYSTNLSRVAIACSSEVAIPNSKRPPVRLAALLVDASGTPAGPLPLLSPEFIVITQVCALAAGAADQALASVQIAAICCT